MENRFTCTFTFIRINRGQDTRANRTRPSTRPHAHLPFRQDAQPPVPWRHTVEGADSTKHTQTETRGRGCQEVKGGDGSKPCARARSQPLPALTYRGRPAAFAPRSLSIHVHVGLARRFIPCFSSNVTPCMLGSPTLATCRCRAATVFTYLLTYIQFPNRCRVGAL